MKARGKKKTHGLLEVKNDSLGDAALLCRQYCKLNPYSMAGARSLTASRHIASLTVLDLGNNAVGDDVRRRPSKSATASARPPYGPVD